MNNADTSAYPSTYQIYEDGELVDKHTTGLTKREYYIGQAVISIK